MYTKTVKVTPEMAKEWLTKKNKVNRPLKQMTVDIYTRYMSLGLWREETAETIKFGQDGYLRDGQHRLHAVVNANVTLNFLVAYDLPNDIFTVLDTGTKRTAGDVLCSEGIKNGNKIAAGVRKYYMLKIAQIHHSKAPSNGEINELYLSRQKTWDGIIEMAEKWYRKERLISTSEMIGFYGHFYDINQDDAFEFMEKLCSGDNIEPNSPIKLLRSKLVLAKSPKLKLNPTERTALIIKTWNYFRNKTVVSKLYFDSKREKFPTAI